MGEARQGQKHMNKPGARPAAVRRGGCERVSLSATAEVGPNLPSWQWADPTLAAMPEQPPVPAHLPDASASPRGVASPPPSPPPSPPAPLAPPEEFLGEAERLGIVFEPGEIERLGSFLALMLETNKTTNLTAITDPGQAWMKHILDALTIVPVLASLEALSSPERSDGAELEGAEASAEKTPAPDPPGSLRGLSVIDVGSGGGVPAIPLAIVSPRSRFTLVEATGKKVDFLRRCIGTLGLRNVRVIQGRAEALGQDHKLHREKYDLGMARALGHLAVVAELVGPLVNRGGLVVAVKGAKAEQELGESSKAFGMLGLRHTETIATPTGRLVVMEKSTRTPRLYPRRDGEPGRLPLGLDR